MNQSPSFKTDAGLDTRVKGELIRDTLKLLNLSYRRKIRYINKVKNEMKQRMLTGKTIHLSVEERQEAIKKKQELRSKYEMNNLGGFELIYPPEKESLYDYYKGMQDQAHTNWEEFTTGRKRCPPTKFVVQNKNLQTV